MSFNIAELSYIYQEFKSEKGTSFSKRHTTVINISRTESLKNSVNT